MGIVASQNLSMKKFLMGFVYAWHGVKDALGQRNMRVHLFVGVLVLIAGVVLKISLIEWLIVIFLTGVITAAEVINTAIEVEADIMRDELGAPYSLMGRAKDLGSGAVLILAVTAVILGLAIFLPRVLNLIL